MMLLFGGVPDIYFERLRERAAKELNEDHFTGLPLLPNSSQNYVLNKEYCGDLLKTLVAFVENRPTALDQGLGIVLLLRERETNQFQNEFWPFGMCTAAYVNERISRDGLGARRVANVYATEAISAARRLKKPIRALTTEFADRLRRTPLLLPVRHFDSSHLITLINRTLGRLINSAMPSGEIKAACQQFEVAHPFRKEGRGGSFESPTRVKFKGPGRDLHGRRPVRMSDEHNEVCFLSARVRLGGFFLDEFHYDCTRGKGAYSGTFQNCHGTEAYYMGRPHLNVYPNDFIRC